VHSVNGRVIGSTCPPWWIQQGFTSLILFFICIR
jgi:hypothetical protein